MERVRCHSGALQCWGKNFTQHAECNRAVCAPPLS